MPKQQQHIVVKDSRCPETLPPESGWNPLWYLFGVSYGICLPFWIVLFWLARAITRRLRRRFSNIAQTVQQLGLTLRSKVRRRTITRTD
jgi:hypothetical protein